jgi:hypothetical protein
MDPPLITYFKCLSQELESPKVKYMRALCNSGLLRNTVSIKHLLHESRTLGQKYSRSGAPSGMTEEEAGVYSYICFSKPKPCGTMRPFY